MVISINEGTDGGQGDAAVLDRTRTVTPENPTPPTNSPAHGQTPPHLNTLDVDDLAADVDPDATTVFAAAISGQEHEGAGEEDDVTTSYTAPPHVDNVMVSVNNELYTTQPNATHASSLSPEAAPAITSLDPDDVTAAAGTTALTVNGSNFTSETVVYVNGVAQTTVYVNSGQLTVAAAPKKETAGTLPVHVVVDGAVASPAVDWTFV